MPSFAGSGSFPRPSTDEAARWHESVLESLAEGVLVVDAGGRLRYANPSAARMLGYSVPELLSHDASAHDLLHHSHADGTPYAKASCPVWRSMRERVAVRTPTAKGEVLWRKDGRPLPVSYVTAPIARDGRVVGAAILVSDATERLRHQDERATYHREAAESEKLAALGTLVSGLSHEVKTPLTILQNSAFLARSQIAGLAERSPEVARERERLEARFDEMEEAVDRMKTLVGELRRFSRLDQTQTLPTTLEDVVEHAARLFRLAYRSSVAVELDLQPTRPVLVDVFKVQQLVLNLLENAADAVIDRGGVVRLRTRMAAGSDRAELVVEDEGPGIPQAMRTRIFDPLFTTKEEGTGLGLAIVQRIAAEHGATIACESAQGRGTTFTVAFPLAGAHPQR